MREIIYLFKKPDGEYGCVEAVNLLDSSTELFSLYGAGVFMIAAVWPEHLTIMDINDQSKTLFESEVESQGFYLEIKKDDAS